MQVNGGRSLRLLRLLSCQPRRSSRPGALRRGLPGLRTTSWNTGIVKDIESHIASSKDEKTIYVAGSGASKMKIQYNTLRIFDDTSTSGVEAPTLSDIEDQQSDNFLPPKKFFGHTKVA